jgi:hypothetical protein
MIHHKLGKTEARPGAISFKFAEYFTAAALPTPPAVFGHYGAVGPWGVLGNNKYGDCVLAGAAHETMLWTSVAGDVAAFDDSSVLSDYAAITGFNPNNPSTDQGTDMQAAAEYRRKTGLLDAAGNRHIIDAYVAPEVGNVDELLTATYLFGAVGIGVRFPSSAVKQFDTGKPWSVVSGDRVDGGHYVPCVGRAPSGNLVVITWGRAQEMELEFFKRYNDENAAYLSLEMLKDSVSPEGVNLDQLERDLSTIAN